MARNRWRFGPDRVGAARSRIAATFHLTASSIYGAVAAREPAADAADAIGRALVDAIETHRRRSGIEMVFEQVAATVAMVDAEKALVPHFHRMAT